MLTQILPATNLLLIVVISVIVLNNFIYLSRHRNNKNKMMSKMSYLYPLVKPQFYNQPLAQQTVENNHEIHEINKKIEAMQKRLDEIEKLSEQKP